MDAFLQHQWTFYLHYPTFNLDTRHYSDQAYERLADVSSVEAFWTVLESLPKPSDVFSGRDAHHRVVRSKINGRHLEAFGFFKAGVKPEWEFSVNLKGGHFECRKDLSLDMVDRLWYETLLALVGEVLESGREVVGARIVDKSKSRKTEFRLEIWVATTCQDVRNEVWQNVMDVLAPYDHTLDFTWKSHGDSLATMMWCNAENLGIDIAKEF